MCGFIHRIAKEIIGGRARRERFDKMVEDMHRGSGEIRMVSTSGEREIEITRRMSDDNRL